MKIIAVVGTGSGCGKTTVVCGILQAIPGLGAVKISPRDGPGKVEWGPGEAGKDTDLYVGSGAVRVARIIGPRDAVGTAWATIRSQFEGCRGVVIEGMSALDLHGERFVVFVVGKAVERVRKEKIRTIAALSDLIIDRSSHSGAESSLASLRDFLAAGTAEEIS